MIIFESKEEYLKKNEAALFTDLKSLVQKIQSDEIGDESVLICENTESTFQDFAKNFKWIEAAGGLVQKQDQLLFIKRFGKWDLPKGKIESQEAVLTAAKREIEEECNIRNLIYHADLPKTYHIYRSGKTTYLKKTHWFYFSLPFDDEQRLIPQVEEGIEEICWFSRQNLDAVYKNTYENIITVLEGFRQLIKSNIP